MSLERLLLEIASTVVRGLANAARAETDADKLDAARGALMAAVAEVESALAREKFPELREP